MESFISLSEFLGLYFLKRNCDVDLCAERIKHTEDRNKKKQLDYVENVFVMLKSD